MSDKKIIVACDFSEIADEAIRQADQWARTRSARLVVCHALPVLVQVNPVFTGRTTQQVDSFVALQRLVHDKLSERVASLTGRDRADFDVVVEPGRADAVLIGQSEAPGALAIVLGNRGLTGLERVILGSVAERVVRHAPIPVLIVRPAAGSQRILAATDFSDPALPAIRAAVEEARARGARLTITHCIEVEPSALAALGIPFGGAYPVAAEVDIARVRSESLGVLRSMTERLSTDADLTVEIGDPVVAVVRLAERERADLIVIGTRGRTGLTRLVLGGVAEKIVRLAPCSVLVVRLEGDSI